MLREITDFDVVIHGRPAIGEVQGFGDVGEFADLIRSRRGHRLSNLCASARSTAHDERLDAFEFFSPAHCGDGFFGKLPLRSP